MRMIKVIMFNVVLIEIYWVTVLLSVVVGGCELRNLIVMKIVCIFSL